MNLCFEDRLLEYKEIFFNQKKYYLIFLALVLSCFASTLSQKNISHPKFELIALIIIILLGFFCISYYFANNCDRDLYKVAFVVILCFGIITAFVVPIMDVSDEIEHFTRAEITSRGVIFPHWNGEEKGLTSPLNLSSGDKKTLYPDVGYETISSIDFFFSNREKTVFETDHDTDDIDDSKMIFSSAFEQNPFYGYLPQAIGILLAKLLDLNVIWMMWLGRIFNLISYAFLIALSIRKAPVLKVPLLSVSCIPIAIYQAASLSIDSLLFGLGILAVAYFIFMCKSENLTERHLFAFTTICLLLGLCKLPYLAFIFLMLFIPGENFKEVKNLRIKIFLCIAVVALIGILWSNYASPTLLHSWRVRYGFNSAEQINYLFNNPQGIYNFITHIFSSYLLFLANGLFNFFNGKLGAHYTDHYVFITLILQIFLAICLFAYPEETDFSLKTKLGALAVVLVVYVGTCFIQLLTWANVGKLDLGISIRYFIPLIALFPVIVRIRNNPLKNRNFNHYAIVFIIGFLAALTLAFVTKYY